MKLKLAPLLSCPRLCKHELNFDATVSCQTLSKMFAIHRSVASWVVRIHALNLFLKVHTCKQLNRFKKLILSHDTICTGELELYFCALVWGKKKTDTNYFVSSESSAWARGAGWFVAKGVFWGNKLQSSVILGVLNFIRRCSAHTQKKNALLCKTHTQFTGRQKQRSYLFKSTCSWQYALWKKKKETPGY